MPNRATKIGALEMVVGAAPTTPIPVVPGQRIKATVAFRNGGVLPIPLLTFRLALRAAGVLETWIEGPAEDYATVANVAAGASASADVYRWVPSAWGAGVIYGRVDARVDTGPFQVIEDTYNPVAPAVRAACWEVLPPSPTWLADVIITYSVA